MVSIGDGPLLGVRRLAAREHGDEVFDSSGARGRSFCGRDPVEHGVAVLAREDLEHRFRLITERYTPLMKFLEDVRMPLPEALQTASDYVLHSDVARLFQNGLVDLDRFAPRIAAVELVQIERLWRSSRRVRKPQKSGLPATGVP